MRPQEEIPGWVVAHVLDVGEGGVGARSRERWPRDTALFPKTQRTEVVVMKDGKEQGEGKKDELGSRTVSSFRRRIFFLFFSFFFFLRVFSHFLKDFFHLLKFSSFPCVCVPYLSTRFLSF